MAGAEEGALAKAIMDTLMDRQGLGGLPSFTNSYYDPSAFNAEFTLRTADGEYYVVRTTLVQRTRWIDLERKGESQ
jgi:hypothetical protein